MATITASVGIAKGKQCYNVSSDQKTVQQLLSAIKDGDGGSEGKSDWQFALWGKCAPDLANAIMQFQQKNRTSLGNAPDGHVDPGGGTLQLMNRLASSTPATAASAFDGLPGGSGALGDSDRTPNVAVDLNPMFAMGLVKTQWKLESSASLGLSVAWAAGSGGEFYLSHGTEKHTLRYLVVGGDLSPLPGSLTVGTASMPSVGSYLYAFSSRTDIDLKDLVGPLVILNGEISTAVTKVGYGTGYGASAIWFGSKRGFGQERRLYQAIRDRDSPKLISALMKQISTSCGAVGFLRGAWVGVDMSVSICGGLALPTL